MGRMLLQTFTSSQTSRGMLTEGVFLLLLEMHKT